MYNFETFLLDSELAKELYDEVKNLPIIDAYSHLSPRALYKNEPFTDIVDMFLKEDSNKWRLMRNSGALEYQITGDDPKHDKFEAFASSIERAYLHPIQHETVMELNMFFNIHEVLQKENAQDIYKNANKTLAETEMGPRDVLNMTAVETMITQAGLNDDLEFHTLLRDDGDCEINVLAAFNPGELLDFNNPGFFDVITLLEKSTSTTITGITTLATALSKRLDFFNKNDGMIASHILSDLHYHNVTKSTASKILKKRLMEYLLTPQEVEQLQVYLLKFFLKEYAIRDMTCQIQIGVRKKTKKQITTKTQELVGSYSIVATSSVDDLELLLTDIESHYPLPKMIIYTYHTNDYDALASLCAGFCSESPGKIQLGAPLAVNAHEEGIKKQLVALATHGNLSTSVGPISDARTTTSMVRHDYFRRVLCNFVANYVHLGRIPNHKEKLIQLVQDISYNNARHYFLQ